MKSRHASLKLAAGALAAGFFVFATSGWAYPPFVRRAEKYGAQDCTFCHTSKGGGPSWNERGQWLIAEKKRRGADQVDVDWLAEYKAGGAGAAAPAAPEAAKGEWRQLFDGRSLDGWEHVGPGSFVLENGTLRTDGGMGLLWYTRETFGDCVIRVVYKTTNEAANSGVFVRIAEKPKDEWFAVHHGYEVQILDKNDEYHRTGAIYSLSKSTSLPTKAPGEWNTMEITLRGPRVEVRVNGTLVNDFDPQQPVPERTKDFEPERGPRPNVGYIGIQNHDDYVGDMPTHVYFKEVSVRKL